MRKQTDGGEVIFFATISFLYSVPPATMVQTQETTSYYFLISLLISFDSFVNFLAKLSLYAAISTIL